MASVTRRFRPLTATVALLAVLTASILLCPCAEPPRSADRHDCCATVPGLRAAADVCCSEPGDASLVASVPVVPSPDAPATVAALTPPFVPERSMPFAPPPRGGAASPPPVLRI